MLFFFQSVYAAAPESLESLRVAVKYVALRPSSAAAPVVSRDEVEKVLEQMSELWSACNVRFVLEEFLTPTAEEVNLPYHPSGAVDRYHLRKTFTDPARAVYIVTGKWDRARDPNDNGSNAFSSVPGDGPQGIVLESWVAKSHRLLAHEFGHISGDLDDTAGEDDLMNHMVGKKNTKLSQKQCARVVAGLKSVNANWLRRPESLAATPKIETR